MKRITARLREALARRKKHWRVLHSSRAHLEDALDALDELDADLDRKLRRLTRLRKQGRRPDKRESLAEEIEALRGAKDQLLERIVERREKNARLKARIDADSERIQELKAKRRRILVEKEGQVGKYWHRAEFDCRIPPPVPDYMADPLDEWARLFGDPLRERFGSGHVNSGHRWGGPPAAYNYNASIGGEFNSYHCYEARKASPAADLRFERGTPSEWAAYARQLADGYGRGGVGQYSTFVHVDTRPYRSNWWG